MVLADPELDLMLDPFKKPKIQKPAQKQLSGSDALSMAKDVNITINNEPAPRPYRIGGRLDAHPGGLDAYHRKPRLDDIQKEEQFGNDKRIARGRGPAKLDYDYEMEEYQNIEDDTGTGSVRHGFGELEDLSGARGRGYGGFISGVEEKGSGVHRDDDFGEVVTESTMEEDTQEVARPDNVGEAVMAESDSSGRAWHDVLIDMYAKKNPFISRSRIASAVLDVANSHYENFMKSGQDKGQYNSWVKRGLGSKSGGSGKYGKSSGSRYVDSIGKSEKIGAYIRDIRDVQGHISRIQKNVTTQKANEVAGDFVGGRYVAAEAAANDLMDDNAILGAANNKAASIMRLRMGAGEADSLPKDAFRLLVGRLKAQVIQKLKARQDEQEIANDIQKHGNIDRLAAHIVTEVWGVGSPVQSGHSGNQRRGR